jgi:tRNA(Arg) A34 adenosine deaminase TadA
MCDWAKGAGFDTPPWLRDYAASYVGSVDASARMRFVIEAARRNIVEATGGPFAAGVFEVESGELVALGVNLVESQGLSVLHAEMVAIMLAQRRLETFDLGRGAKLELVTSTEPCAMCFGAIPWSGLQRVICGARTCDAENIGFDEGSKPQAWREAFKSRGIETICDVERELAAGVLQNYVRSGGKIYNGAPSAYGSRDP